VAGLKTESELIDLKERIATCGAFDHEETMFILEAVNASTVPELVSLDGGEPGHVDSQRTIALTHDILRTVRRHYQMHALARDRVLEVLNALAFVVEAVLSATGHDAKACEFFDRARAQNRMEAT
jgi:hypothetical protein